MAANGGVSVITAILIEPNGTPVSNGTVVLFFSDIGIIDRQGTTKDGIARVNFVADSRSGVANIRRYRVAQRPTWSTPTPSPGASTPPGGGSGGTGEATTTVTVGNVRINAIGSAPIHRGSRTRTPRTCSRW